MEDPGEQKELFKLDKPRKARFPRLRNFFPKSDFTGGLAVTVSLEKAVFIAIGLVMIMVVVYAMGVERGRAINRQKALEPEIAIVKKAQKQASLKTGVVVTPQPEKAVDPARPALKSDSANPYTIVAAAFGTREAAEREVARLAKIGFDSYLRESESYFLACVGKYPSMEKTKRTLAKVKGVRKDAYVISR